VQISNERLGRVHSQESLLALTGGACEHRTVLLAEMFVLLALEPDGTLARGTANQPAVAVGVTGALVAELVQDGNLDLTDGRIHLTGSMPTHPLLAQTLASLAPHEGKKLKSRLSSVKHAGWREVVDGMVAAGVLGRERGTLRPTRHPVVDVPAHAELLAEVRAAATGDQPLNPRTATLLALAGPSQMLEVVAPKRSDRAAAKRRIAAAAEQVPAAAAVKHVVDAMHAAVAFVASSGGAP
jgi:hypothetical protein